MKNTIFIAIIFFSLIGCSKEYTILPSNLPIAHVDQPYSQIIEISGGRAAGLEITTSFPKDMNITIQPKDPDNAAADNNLRIMGVPKYKGKYTISISTGFYAGGGRELNKTYDFVVKD